MYYVYMPVVMRIGSIKFYIYPQDHRPAHVHVISADSEAKFEILTGECIANYGFNQKSIKALSREIVIRQAELLEAWKEYEGEE